MHQIRKQPYRNKISRVLLLVIFSCVVALLPGNIVHAENASAYEDIILDIDSSVNAVLTSIGSKKMERLSDAPGIVTVITQDELMRFGGITLDDIIQRAPSLQFLGSNLFPENTMVMRGALQSHYDNHILILINGRPFRDDLAGGHNATIYETFPVDVIEHIEFIRGPGSVLYGTNAFDGVINIVTKRKFDEPGTDIVAGGGSFGGRLGKTRMEFKKGDFDILSNVTIFRDDGWDFRATTVYPGTSQDSTSSMKYFKDKFSTSVFLNGKGCSLNAYHASIARGILGNNPVWQAGGDGQSWLEEKRTFVDAGYSRKMVKEYTVNANATFNYCSFASHTLMAASTENSYSVLGEVFVDGPVAKNMNCIFGSVVVERWNESKTGQKIPKDNEFYHSLYTQINYTPTDKIKLFTGAQYNKSPAVEGVIVPRIGGIVNITDILGAKINYSSAFRSAMPLETRVYFPGVIIGNRHLQPEMVNTVDLQVFCYLRKFQCAVTLFQNSYSDLIGRIPHPVVPATTTYDNTGSMEIRGMEVDGKIDMAPGLSLVGSATYQKEIDSKVFTPRYLAKGGISYASSSGLTAGIFNNYYGKPDRITAGKEVNPAADAVHLVSINIDYILPFYTPVKLNVFIQNALDQKYYFPEFNKEWVNTLPLEPGRAIYCMLSYHF